MTNKIRDLESLQLERQRLSGLLLIQKDALKNDLQIIQKQLEPASKVLNTVGSFTGNGAGKSILQTGLGLGLDVLLGNTLFRKAGAATKLAVPFLIRNVSSGIANGKAGKILGAIGGFFSRKKKPATA